MKIIDFEKKGNVVRFYLGDNKCDDYWGDDWNDAPYDCNAGAVYERYVNCIVDVAFQFDDLVLEQSDDGYSARTYFSKEDMKNRKLPCIIVVPQELNYGFKNNFSDWVGSDKVTKFYFGDPSSVLDKYKVIKAKVC